MGELGKILSAFIRTIPSIIVRVLIPIGMIYALSLMNLPQEVLSYLNENLGLYSFFYGLAAMGIVISLLSFVGGILNPGSRGSLVVSLFRAFLSIYFSLYLVTLGNIGGMGKLTLKFPFISQPSIMVSLDYTIVVYLVIVAGFLSILKCVFDWASAKGSGV